MSAVYIVPWNLGEEDSNQAETQAEKSGMARIQTLLCDQNIRFIHIWTWNCPEPQAIEAPA